MTYPDFPPAPTPTPMFPTATKAAVWRGVPTNNDVAFISIDDGYDEDLAAADFVEEHQVPLTAFLTYYAASSGAYPPPTSGTGLAHIEYLRRFH